MFSGGMFLYIILTLGVSTVESHLNLGVPFPEIHTVFSCEYSIRSVLESCVTLLVVYPVF